MKKILFISAFPPGIKTAGQNYTYNLLKDLAYQNHKIDLIFSGYKDHTFNLSDPGINVIRSYSANRLVKFISCLKVFFLHPFFTSRFHFRTVFFLLKNAGKYDAVYLDFSQVFIYTLFLRHKHIFLMVHDVVSQKYKRKKGLLSSINTAWVFNTEKLLLKKKNTRLLCFSYKDERMLKKLFSRSSDVVSIYFDEQIQQLKEGNLIEKDFFCFYGAWNRNENLDGLLWFFNTVAPKLPGEIKYMIIGGGLPKVLPDYMIGNNIIPTGFINNPYELLASAKALIAPVFQGAGVKFKVLEAFACGSEVIGSDLAFEGISPLMKQHMLNCKNEEDYIRAIEEKWNTPTPHESRIKLREKFLRSYAANKFLDLLQ